MLICFTLRLNTNFKVTKNIRTKEERDKDEMDIK